MKVIVKSLNTAWRIRQEHLFDGFFGVITEGKQRLGKSSYNCQCLAEAFGEWEYEDIDKKTVEAVCVKQDYERVKKWVVFPPREFLDLIFTIPIGKKEMAVYWSDAGFWLFVLDWYDPFVKSVAKYIQLCGRQFAAVMFSSPSKRLISGKVLESMPEFHVCRISRRGRDDIKKRPRLAKVYERWDFPDGKKGGVKTRWEDKYDAILPDPFFEWYKPISDKYLEVGRRILAREMEKIMKARLGKKPDKKEGEEQLEDVHKMVGDPDKLKEIDEVLQMYAPT